MSLWEYYQKGSFSFERPIWRRKFVRLRRIIFLIPLLVLAAAPAHALDVGTCDTPEGLSTKLKAEGHKIIASMDMIGVSAKEGGKAGYAVELITATPDLKRWYAVKGDHALGTKSTRLCIAAKGRNLEINDYRHDARPTVTRYRFDKKKALAACHEIAGQLDGCREYYEGLRILEEDTGERVALQAESDGGRLVTIIANSGGKNAYHVLMTVSAGATGIARRGVRFAFSEWVRKALDKQS